MKLLKILISLIFLVFKLNAQEIKLSITDSVIFSAMKDEMDRSMQEYEDPEAGKFFYIMYQIDNGQSITTGAELGSIIVSDTNRFRSQSYRIMLGDYDFNDENFISSSRDDYNQEMYRLEVPLNDDYMGIRRALWNYTEMAFNNCVKSYIGKKEYFEEHPDKKPKIPDFVKVEPTLSIRNIDIDILDKKRAEDLVKKISMVFRDYNDIEESFVVFNQIKIDVYLLSTEGTKCKIPLNYSMLNINASAKNDTVEELSFNESITFYEINPENFVINSNEICKSSKKLAEYIINIDKLEEIKEDYEGPVIYSGLASSMFFYNTLFGREGKLIAQREAVSDRSSYFQAYKNPVSMEDKIGEELIPNNFTIIDRPKLESFQGKILYGTTYVDREGVAPQDSLVIIQKGILKTLLCNRIPTKSINRSTGNERLGVSSSSSLREMSPSNLFVEYSNGVEDKKLIDKLIVECESNKIDFGIEIKALDEFADQSPLVYYKVEKDGTKTMLKPMNLPNSSFKTLNKVIDCSTNLYICNILNGNYRYQNPFNRYATLSGSFTGLVVPSSVLIKDAEIPYSGYNNYFPSLY